MRLIFTARATSTEECGELSAQAIHIDVPPLRKRAEDIPLLVAHFAPEQEWSPETIQALCEYSWPGNVAELRQTISYAATLANGDSVVMDHLPPAIRDNSSFLTNAQNGFQILLPQEGIDLEQVEKSLIEEALTRTEGNKTRAERLLSISRATLLYRLEKYGLS